MAYSKRRTSGGREKLVTTMNPSYSGAENMAEFLAGAAQAIAEGKTYYIPNGDYSWGDTSQISTINLAAGDELIVENDGNLLVSSGSQNNVLLVTTEDSWVDYSVSAVATATSGGNMATNQEWTKLTLSSPPASIEFFEHVSVYSQDAIIYLNDTAANIRELNYSHEASRAMVMDSSDVYIAHKLKLNYTNGVKMRRYNNTGARFEWTGHGSFDTDGDWLDTGVTGSQRPKFIIEMRGLVSPIIHNSVRVKRAWGGTFYFVSCISPEDHSHILGVLNNLSGVSALGYAPACEGATLNPIMSNKTQVGGRHLPTSIWKEEAFLQFSGVTVGATTTFTGCTSYDSSDNPDGNAPAINDTVGFASLVGTISAMNNNRYTVTASSGNFATGTGTFTVSFDSTGLAYTSGGVGYLFQPDQVHRYGVVDGTYVHGIVSTHTLGAALDEHENNTDPVYDGIYSKYTTGFTWNSTAGRTINNRACNATYKNIVQDGGAGFATISSFARSHGRANTCVFDGLVLRNQMHRTTSPSNPYFETESDIDYSFITDKRQLIIKNFVVSGGYNRFLCWGSSDTSPLNDTQSRGNVLIQNGLFIGDWAGAATADYLIDNYTPDSIVIEDVTFDMTEAVTNPQYRLLVNRNAGAITFRRVHFKNIGANTAGTHSQFPISIRTTSGSVVTFENCTFEYSSGATDTTCRFAQTDNVSTTFIFRGANTVINAAKMQNTRPLINSNNTSGVATVIIEGRIVSDAAYNIVGVTSSGTFTITDRAQRLREVTASGTITVVASDDIIAVNKTTGAATAVSVTPANLVRGKLYTIHDKKGDAGTNNITVTPTAGNINGAASLVLSTNYGSVTFYSDGTNLFTL